MNRMQNSSREVLLKRINEVSFAVSDILLFLDTHPDCQEALAFYQKNVAIRKEALAEYARLYGPLTIDTADDTCSRSWEWVQQPFPWEVKGGCRSMWNYEKRLQYPINIKTPNAKIAQYIMSQYGGPYSGTL